MTPQPTAGTVEAAQEGVDYAVARLAEAIATAHRRHAAAREADTELSAARDALLLADLILKDAEMRKAL